MTVLEARGVTSDGPNGLWSWRRRRYHWCTSSNQRYGRCGRRYRGFTPVLDRFNSNLGALSTETAKNRPLDGRQRRSGRQIPVQRGRSEPWCASRDVPGPWRAVLRYAGSCLVLKYEFVAPDPRMFIYTYVAATALARS